MTYGIFFDSGTPVEALRQALHAVYNVPLELVYAGPYEALNDHPGPDPIVLITPAGGPFSHELSAGDQLLELTKATELELAQAVCRTARTRALVDDGSSDALGPISGEPDLPVVPPPGWAQV